MLLPNRLGVVMEEEDAAVAAAAAVVVAAATEFVGLPNTKENAGFGAVEGSVGGGGGVTTFDYGAFSSITIHVQK